MSQPALIIRRADTSDAATPETVERIVAIINEAYRWSEAEQWTEEKTRTEHAEVSLLLTNQKMLLAYADNTLAGVVKIEEIAPGIGGFGMLATDPDGLKKGVGRALVAEAEAWGRAMRFAEMEIEIVRAESPNAHKILLHEWYTRLGYIEQETYPIAERIPEIAALQRLTCVSTVYRKPLN